MAKNTMKKNSSNEMDNSNELVEVPVVDVRKLWDEIRDIEEREKTIQMQLDSLNFERSSVVKQIKEVSGTGPFQVSGLGLVTIRSRKSKIEGRPDTYFLVSQGNREVTVID